LIAGVVLGMWQMTLEGILHAGQGFFAGLFSPVEYIAATVLGGFNNPSFYPAGRLPPVQALPIVLGLMGHMMNSVILGLIFFGIVSGLRHDRVTSLIAGLVYGVIIFVLMWFVVLPFVDPVMLRVSFVAFLIGHMMFGLGLGLTRIWASLAQA
jgi:hypothetical protein